MAQSKLRRAIGAVKDKTSIGLAKVNNSNCLSDLEVAIVKATRHDEYPAEEKYIREILSLTYYSRHFIGACVNFISRRLNKTKTWVVALKTLMLIHRLLTDGDPAYEQEIFFATRRGTRLLNLSDFRDTSRSNSWDYSAFVRTYALYLDERLEYRMQGRRKKLNSCTFGYEQEDEEQEGGGSASWKTPPHDMNTEQLLSKMEHLQQLLERFLTTRPAGAAKHNRVIIVVLYPIVKESYEIYYDMTDILSILIDKFKELAISDCIKAYNIFTRVSKQFDELDAYYSWCKELGIARSSEYPEVERITPKKLELMDGFIRDISSGAYIRGPPNKDQDETTVPEEPDAENVEEGINQIKTLPPPEKSTENVEEEKKEEEPLKIEDSAQSQEADLLHLGDDAVTSEEHSDKLALALFNSEAAAPAGPAPPPMWETFDDSSDWETSLVQSASYLPHQKPTLGGGFDTMLLDGLYQQGATTTGMSTNYMGGTGSASSVAFGSAGNPPAPMLALPAPPSAEGAPSTNTVILDPFAPSVAVPPPPYVQMTDMEKKQRLLVEEQLMWQQCMRDGMQGHRQLSNYQGRPHGYGN